MSDTQIIDAMVESGGGFVSALGNAARRADAVNLAKIKATWPEYWEKYELVARHHAACEREDSRP